MPRVAIGRHVLGYDEFGSADGTAVLLVHGHPFARGMWRPQAEALAAAGYRVIAPDLRGYGESPLGDDTDGADGADGAEAGIVLQSDFAADLTELLDRLGVRQAVVGGVSMGGQIAMALHAEHPERVLALVLSDTSAPPETPDGREFRNRMADRLLAEGMAGYAEEVIDKMIAPYNVDAQPRLAERIRRMMRETDPRAAAAALRGRAERPDYRPTLSAAAVPALVLVGADDVYTPLPQAEELAGLLPDAELAVIPDAGHLPGAEQPAEFNRRLLAFLLARVPPTSA
ncbi:alpha/beta fold hydrolase [Phaeacidiphilus oryzae]|uniref:alpha/beta fold hydrolase n=1 Tax=Phaeacidiphilus oryzae TaxID=348818 RepID=UPI0005646E12|nr:alpha/beta fold hydrolase [Phaeacidiphilus oryzae]